jgi:diguanylate cyclase (GGDEF)-like protein
MFFIELINNVSLLVVLTMLFKITVSRYKVDTLSQRVVFGLIFGMVGLVGMMTPLHYADGIIFDGRSIILFVAGFFGGPLVAVISASIIGVYRLWLGGAGVYVGMAVIVISAAIGLLLYFYRRKAQVNFSWLHLFIAGFAVHVVVLLLFMLLPGNGGIKIIIELGPTILLVYPMATLLVCLLFQDYDEKEIVRRDLHRLAYYDSVTALPNRLFQIENINRVLGSCKTPECKGALILFSIDRFKTINDARGHAVGDMLLCAVADRLRTVIDSEYTLARNTASEFSVLLRGMFENAQDVDAFALNQASRIHTALKFPVYIGKDEIFISVSLGIATFPRAAEDTAGDVLRRADTAMHRAKQDGGNQTMLFEPTMASHIEQKFQIERELRKAIPAGELRMYLQSQVNSSGVVVGAEALVRWQHPVRGRVMPLTFIPVAEETDLIADIDAWVLKEACTILASNEIYNRPISISVNISPRHFRQSGFVMNVKQILADTGADPTHLKLEITEGLLIHNVNDVIAKMLELTSLGIHFSLDDFGTGYSSLSHLKRLPIHELKIDKTFVQDAPTDPDDAALVESVLAVAKHMKLNVVAEGVETKEQAAFLNARAEVLHQGYLYSRPEPADIWVSKLSESLPEV